MTTPLRIYDSNRVNIIFAGVPLLEFAEGAICEIAYDSDQFLDVVGTDGTVSRSKSNDLRATVTVHLMQTSPSNDFLSGILNGDIRADSGFGVSGLAIVDNGGQSLYVAPDAWIMKFAEPAFGREAQERAWAIRCARLESFTGGNI